MKQSTPLASHSQHEPAVQSTDQDDTTDSATTVAQSISPETIQEVLKLNQLQELESIEPRAAIDLYLQDRSQELRDTTLRTHRSALRFFALWCDQQVIGNLNELTGRDLQRYRLWRRRAGTEKVDTLARESERNQQKIIRLFIKYCETIDAVPIGLHEQVRLPAVSKDDAARSAVLESARVNGILGWLRQHRYANIEHVTWELLAATGARIGSLVALDVDDYYPEAETPHLEVRNRPETLLKNGTSGERLIAIDAHVCEILNDYLDYNRPDVTDPGDRRPLLASNHGRVAKSTIRTYVYRYSRPCAIGQTCPHDTDPDECDATTRHKEAECPSSRSPHAIRRAYITHELAAGVERSLVGGKCDVSESVIEAHYDVRDEHERMQVRQQALRAARQTTERFGGD